MWAVLYVFFSLYYNNDNKNSRKNSAPKREKNSILKYLKTHVGKKNSV